ncbi:hypothetical protein LCGC14_3120390, partial [marine sediment metagenome]
NVSFFNISLWTTTGGTLNTSDMNNTEFEIIFNGSSSGTISIDNMRIYNYTIPTTIWTNCVHNYSSAINTNTGAQFICNITALQDQYLYLWIDYDNAVFGMDFTMDIRGEQS